MKKINNRILELSGVLTEASLGQIKSAGKIAEKKMGSAGKMWDKKYNKQVDKAGTKGQMMHYSQIYNFIEELLKNPAVKPSDVISTLKKIIQDIVKKEQTAKPNEQEQVAATQQAKPNEQGQTATTQQINSNEQEQAVATTNQQQ